MKTTNGDTHNGRKLFNCLFAFFDKTLLIEFWDRGTLYFKIFKDMQMSGERM